MKNRRLKSIIFNGIGITLMILMILMSIFENPKAKSHHLNKQNITILK